MALVSVIIPHFQRFELLKQTLQSVEAQTLGTWEVIIVDDGSSHQEWNAVQALSGDRIRVLQRTDGPKGPSRCRNLGVAAAKGDYLLFLDSDDLLAESCLEQRLEGIGRFPDEDLWVFPAELFRETVGDLRTRWNQLEPQADDLARFLRSDGPWCVSSPIWRRTAFLRAGGFNEVVCYGDDADLHIRALLDGLSVRQFPDAVPDVFIRRSEVPRITNSATGNSEMLNSRLVRLEQGTVALHKSQAGNKYRAIWEGQYFVECEFLLFTQNQPRLAIQRVLDRWHERYRPSLLRRCLVSSYLTFSLFFLRRCYFLVRIARRSAMVLLPADFFSARYRKSS